MIRANEDPYELFLTSDNPAVDAIRAQNLQFGYQLQVNRGEVSKILDEDKAKRIGFGASTVDDEINIKNKPLDQLLAELGR